MADNASINTVTDLFILDEQREDIRAQLEEALYIQEACKRDDGFPDQGAQNRVARLEKRLATIDRTIDLLEKDIDPPKRDSSELEADWGDLEEEIAR